MEKEIKEAIIGTVGSLIFDTYKVENNEVTAVFTIFGEKNTLKFTVDETEMIISISAIEWDIERTIEVYPGMDVDCEVNTTVNSIISECFESTMEHYLY